MPKPISEHEGSKYLRVIVPADSNDFSKGIYVDVYAVLEAFHVTCPATAHCLKKLLTAGERGKGSRLDDLIGAEAALSRAIELERNRVSEQAEKVKACGEVLKDKCVGCYGEGEVVSIGKTGAYVKIPCWICKGSGKRKNDA